MIVIVLGFSKSGTTLVSKTLHESGIDMHPACEGNYNKSKYEDPEVINILLQMFNTKRLQSLYLPKKIIWNYKIRNQIKRLIINRKGDWGIKQPWLTLCYQEWKTLLPPHICVGIKRNYKNLITHWTKRGRTVDEKKLYLVQNTYNTLLDSYNIPIISFEYFLKYGPGQLKKIIGKKLKDVRV